MRIVEGFVINEFHPNPFNFTDYPMLEHEMPAEDWYICWSAKYAKRYGNNSPVFRHPALSERFPRRKK